MKKFVLVTLYFILMSTNCLAREDAPIEVWAGEEVNELATQIRMNAAIPDVVMENVITITALEDNITISAIRVNRGNAYYANKSQPLPVKLMYGEEYKITDETEQKNIDQINKQSKEKGLTKRESSQAAVLGIIKNSNKKHRVMEIEVTLSSGDLWTFKL